MPEEGILQNLVRRNLNLASIESILRGGPSRWLAVLTKAMAATSPAMEIRLVADGFKEKVEYPGIEVATEFAKYNGMDIGYTRTFKLESRAVMYLDRVTRKFPYCDLYQFLNQNILPECTQASGLSLTGPTYDDTDYRLNNGLAYKLPGSNQAQIAIPILPNKGGFIVDDKGRITISTPDNFDHDFSKPESRLAIATPLSFEALTEQINDEEILAYASKIATSQEYTFSPNGYRGFLGYNGQDYLYIMTHLSSNLTEAALATQTNLPAGFSQIGVAASVYAVLKHFPAGYTIASMEENYFAKPHRSDDFASAGFRSLGPCEIFIPFSRNNLDLS